MIALDHRDRGNRANPYTEPYSCFIDSSDSLNLLNSLNSMNVPLHFEKTVADPRFPRGCQPTILGNFSRKYTKWNKWTLGRISPPPPGSAKALLNFSFVIPEEFYFLKKVGDTSFRTEKLIASKRWNYTGNKKVLLRERKRHTARCVASTPYVVLTGYPPSRVPPWQGTPPAGYPPGQGTPPPKVPPLARVPPGQGTPWAGTPHRQGTPPARVPPSQGTPPRWTWQGTPPSWTWQGTPPQLPHGILGNVAKHYGIRVPPLGVNWQTKWNYYLPVVLRTRAVMMNQ